MSLREVITGRRARTLMHTCRPRTFHSTLQTFLEPLNLHPLLYFETLLAELRDLSGLSILIKLIEGHVLLLLIIMMIFSRIILLLGISGHSPSFLGEKNSIQADVGWDHVFTLEVAHQLAQVVIS